MKSQKPILVVDDDEVDQESIQRSFKKLKILNPVLSAFNGEEALDVLEKESSQTPCLILLDINMPRMNGVEFLRCVKAREKLRRIPVVVLTTSGHERDKFESFDLGVAGYMVKPTDLNSLIETIKTIDLYWTLSELAE